MRQKIVTIAVYVNAVCLALICLYAAIMSPTFNIGFYERQFVRNHTHRMIRITEDDLTKVTLHMMDYMRGRTDSLQIRTYIDGEEVYFFTERAVLHMVDVRDLFTVGRILFYISIVFFVSSLAVCVFLKSFARLLKAYRRTAIITASIYAAIGVIALVNFEFAFEWFHHIFFFNDLWLLNSYDRLLNMVPTPFFISIFIYITTLFTLFLAAMGFGGHFTNRFLIKREEKARGGS